MIRTELFDQTGFPQGLTELDFKQWLTSEFGAEGIYTAFPVSAEFEGASVRGLLCVVAPGLSGKLLPGACIVLTTSHKGASVTRREALPHILGFLCGVIYITPAAKVDSILRVRRDDIAALIRREAVSHLRLLSRYAPETLKRVLSGNDRAWLAAFADRYLMNTISKLVVVQTSVGLIPLPLFALPPESACSNNPHNRNGRQRGKVRVSPINVELLVQLLAPRMSGKHLLTNDNDTELEGEREDRTEYLGPPDEALESTSSVVRVTGVGPGMVFESVMSRQRIGIDRLDLVGQLPGKATDSDGLDITKMIKVIQLRYPELRTELRNISSLPGLPAVYWPGGTTEALGRTIHARFSDSEIVAEYLFRSSQWLTTDAVLILNAECATMKVLSAIDDEDALVALMQYIYDGARAITAGSLSYREQQTKWVDLHALCTNVRGRQGAIEELASVERAVTQFRELWFTS